MIFTDKLMDYSVLEVECPICGTYTLTGAAHDEGCFKKSYEAQQNQSDCLVWELKVIRPDCPGVILR